MSIDQTQHLQDGAGARAQRTGNREGQRLASAYNNDITLDLHNEMRMLANVYFASFR